MGNEVRLIAILDPSELGDGAIEAVRRAARGGASAVQVRMKDSEAGAVLRWTERLVAAVTIPVYVNDRADVAWAAGAAGVHLGADDLSAARVRAHAPPGFRIGVSVGTAAEAERALEAVPDYWSVGAVFATATKADAGAPIGIDGFTALARRAPAAMPVIAIGGITPGRARAVCAAGAAGVAAASAIFAAPDPEAAARGLRTAVDAALALAPGS